MFEGYEYMVWATLGIACATDLLWGKIYNLLTFSSLFIGIGLRFYVEGPASLSDSLLAVVLVFVVAFPLYWLKAFAAGDVKLLMAIAAWKGFAFSVRLSAVSVLLAAVVSLYLLVHRKGWLGMARSVRDHLKLERVNPAQSTRMPFAPAFLSAFLCLKIMEFYQWELF